MRVPHVVNKRSPEWDRRASEYMDIGRPFALGNPFHIGKDGDRLTVIAKFEAYARDNLNILNIIEDIPEGTMLGCYCKPQACHGDVIIKIWKELHGVPE